MFESYHGRFLFHVSGDTVHTQAHIQLSLQEVAFSNGALSQSRELLSSHLHADSSSPLQSYPTISYPTSVWWKSVWLIFFSSGIVVLHSL